jgi:hypothetical protein
LGARAATQPKIFPLASLPASMIHFSTNNNCGSNHDGKCALAVLFCFVLFVLFVCLSFILYLSNLFDAISYYRFTNKPVEGDCSMTGARGNQAKRDDDDDGS